jgi:hypothetical protein
MAKSKEVVHIHYVHHIHHYPSPAAAAPAQPIMAPMMVPTSIMAPMVHASMPGQPHTDIMTAPGYYNAGPEQDKPDSQ